MQFFKPRPPTGFSRNLVPPPIPKSQNQDKLKQLGSSSRCSQDSSRISRLLNRASYLDFTFTHKITFGPFQAFQGFTNRANLFLESCL